MWVFSSKVWQTPREAPDGFEIHVPKKPLRRRNAERHNHCWRIRVQFPHQDGLVAGDVVRGASVVPSAESVMEIRQTHRCQGGQPLPVKVLGKGCLRRAGKRPTRSGGMPIRAIAHHEEAVRDRHYVCLHTFRHFFPLPNDRTMRCDDHVSGNRGAVCPYSRN